MFSSDFITLQNATIMKSTENTRISQIRKDIELILEIWNYYIRKHKFFRKHTNLKDNFSSNYGAMAIRYLIDTFSVIEYEKVEAESHYANFANAISFMQAMYIQQDLIWEFLLMFSCKIEKGDLKQDENYTINRNIRNELVGHPIRRNKRDSEEKERLISFTFFSNAQNIENIAYFKWHIDNGYDLENIKVSRTDIKHRHYTFLETYIKIIIDRLKELLREFKKVLLCVEKAIDNNIPFTNLLKLLKDQYEGAYIYDEFYSEENLISIYNRRNEYKRYEVVIEEFYADLKTILKESIDDIDIIANNKQPYDKPLETSDSETISISVEAEKDDYSYELGKLVDKDDFAFYSLEKNCADNPSVMDELKHMRDNMSNDLEYCSAYKYLNRLLRD